jgi:hypothetical protein
MSVKMKIKRHHYLVGFPFLYKNSKLINSLSPWKRNDFTAFIFRCLGVIRSCVAEGAVILVVVGVVAAVGTAGQRGDVERKEEPDYSR